LFEVRCISASYWDGVCSREGRKEGRKEERKKEEGRILLKNVGKQKVDGPH